MDTQINQDLIPKTYTQKKRVYVLIGVLASLFIVFYFLISAPFSSAPTVVHISSRESINSVTNELINKNVIRSKKVLKAFIFALGGDKDISVGDYYFEKNCPVWRVAWMLSHGVHNISPIKVTFQEGLTNDQVAELLSKNIPNFNKDLFLDEVAGKQGYLFPDTYFFYPLSKIDEIKDGFSLNFNKKISKYKSEISNSKHSLNDLIIMASILEKEAKGDADNELIAGILWKRISLKMPLQVDAAPETYKNKGLPKDPISNPGLSSILAALHPKESNYLFYLHDKNGIVHFATTYKEHKNNINIYLK